jgi:hypothetical protein
MWRFCWFTSAMDRASRCAAASTAAVQENQWSVRRKYESSGEFLTVAAVPWLAEECSLLHPRSYDTAS